MEKNILSIGIDPGSRNGAIAVIDSELNILKLTKLPFIEEEVKSKKLKKQLNKETNRFENSYRKRAWTDYIKVGQILQEFKNNEIIYTVEDVFVRQGESATQSFIFGHSFGIFRCLNLYLNPIEYYEPSPQLWKNTLGVTSDKSTSIELVNEIFKEQLNAKRIILKSKNSHADLAEALLLSYYGFLQYYNKSKKIRNRNNGKERKRERN